MILESISLVIAAGTFCLEVPYSKVSRTWKRYTGPTGSFEQANRHLNDSANLLELFRGKLDEEDFKLLMRGYTK